MNSARCFRLAMVALVPAAAISLSFGQRGLAQAPAASAAGAGRRPPAPAPNATPAPAAKPAGTPPAAATTAGGSAVQTADPFGEEITLAAEIGRHPQGQRQLGFGVRHPDRVLQVAVGLLDKQGIKPAGNPMIVYTSTDDTGFTYLAEIPVEQDPKNLTKAMSMGKSPDGKALKFVHRGSYDNMDNTYEAITNHLDDKKLEAKDTFIEEYITDPLKTAEDKLVINVYVPLK